MRKKDPAVSLDANRELGFCEPVDDEESPEDSLMRKERAPAIAAALAKLNDEHRTILVLREIERFDYASIARVLDLNVGTVRSRLHRARMQMRKLLYRSGLGQAVPDGNRLEQCETAIRQAQPDLQSC
jgi:RNA polymerase sigma-70 factor (ECF subfamily)